MKMKNVDNLISAMRDRYNNRKADKIAMSSDDGLIGHAAEHAEPIATFGMAESTPLDAGDLLARKLHDCHQLVENCVNMTDSQRSLLHANITFCRRMTRLFVGEEDA